MKKCSIEEWDKAILGELASYRQEVTDALKKDVKTVAKECAAEIKEGSPYLTGSYKKGWRTKIEFESDDDIRITVHNRTDYQLTHLLEYGHAGKGGTPEGAASPHPHIRPAEEHAEKKLLKKVKVAIKGGS